EGDSFERMWKDLAPLGRDPDTSGYRRHAWTPVDLELRAWFTDRARERGLTVETDRNGNQWALLGDPATGGVVATGSHLDSVPDGGAFDGPLGVVSALAALDELHRRGARPHRPLAVVNFADEEGARFGLACVGSRLAVGALDPERARRLRDAEGTTLASAMERAGHDPGALGPDPDRLGRLAAFVELHVEQGRVLAALPDGGRAVGVGSAVWPHGRWRLDFRGEANHAGTTRLEDRRDPMLTYANTVLAARKKARLAGALAGFGRVRVEPNAVNAVPSLVSGWLDARAPDHACLDGLVADIGRAAAERARRDGTSLEIHRESFTEGVDFDHALRDRLAAVLADPEGRPAPLLPTGAGHDAGILAAALPTAMLYVRNPTGVSHAPAEHADAEDRAAGVTALADVLEELSCR
ncbi:allantoate amidohydrolase, partial [Streptomyces alkaliphilus]